MLKTRLGAPGLIAIIALVFAVGGGAAVAASGLTKAEKKQVRNIAKSESKKWSKKFSKRFAKRGPKGATGAQGAQGVPGPAGPIGPKGANGANGVSVTSAPASGEECPNGGTKLTSASGSSAVSNGEEGSPWAAGGVLPSEETETGTWGTQLVDEEKDAIAFSFTLPVEPAPEPVFVTGAEEPGCPGVIGEVPTAEPGFLCVYVGSGEIGGITVEGFVKPTEFNIGAGPSGSALLLKCTSPSCVRFGSWAVTAE